MKVFAVLWACMPWLLTGGVGMWQWQRYSTRGDDLRHVVLVALVICGLACLFTLVEAFRVNGRVQRNRSGATWASKATPPGFE